MIVKQQIDYAQKREAGYNKKSLIYHAITGDIEKNYELIKNELLQSGAAKSVSKTSAPLTEGGAIPGALNGLEETLTIKLLLTDLLLTTLLQQLQVFI